MSRVHDMGGRLGDGPVDPDRDAPVFDTEWHARALAVTVAAGTLGQFNIDASRHARECLDPVDYTAFSYYEKWLAGLADLLEDAGVVSRQELAGTDLAVVSPLAGRKLSADQVAPTLARGAPYARASDVSATYRAGDRVKTRPKAGNTFVDGGHTRLPGYASGAVGTVVLCHGSFVLPDANAHGLGEAPEPLYAVAFEASQLWPNPENPKDEVILDLWQSYLEPA